MDKGVQETLQIVNELISAKETLKGMEVANKLKSTQKIYRKLSDIEILLGRIECHSNASMKYQKITAEMIYHLVKDRCNYRVEDSKEGKGIESIWWNKICQVQD